MSGLAGVRPADLSQWSLAPHHGPPSSSWPPVLPSCLASWVQRIKHSKLMNRGFSQVTEGHPQHRLLENIRLCLRRVLADQDVSAKFELTSADYESKEIIEEAEDVKLTVFAPAVFATIRAAFGINRTEFVEDVAPANTDIQYLRDYLNHFIKNPHSLIVKILGVYSIQLGKQKPVFFILMQSVFYPDTLVSVRYDIKGCLAGRYQSPASDKNPQKKVEVFKDQNFHSEALLLGEERSWFLKQISRDAEFLRRNEIVDYSLLVGIQRDTDTDRETQLTREKVISSPCDAQDDGPQRTLDSSERKAIWSSLVKLVDDGESELSKDDVARMESRLSNISAMVELLGEGSPMPGNSPTKKSVTILKKFLTPKRNCSVSNGGAVLASSSSTPTNSFQVHPSPSPERNEEHRRNSKGTLKNIFSSIFRNQTKPKIHPKPAKYPAVYNSPYHCDNNTVICAETVNDLFEIKEVDGREFTLDNWQRYLGDRDSNRRNINNEVNAIHIVDGIDVRYYFGIIDIFTTYGWRQKLAHFLKSLRYCGGDHSSLQSELYATRFVDFIENHVM